MLEQAGIDSIKRGIIETGSIFEQYLFHPVIPKGQGYISAGHAQQKEDDSRRQGAGSDRPLFGDLTQTVPQCTGRGGQAGGDAPVFSGGFQKQGGVEAPGFLAGIQQHGFVAAQLQVLGAFSHGNPHQGIEPAHGGAEGEKQLVCRILPAQMNQLVAQNQGEFHIGVGPIRQDDPDGFPEQPD